MSRYIDADRLKDNKEMRKVFSNPTDELYGMLQLIDEQPIADVVEVVQCSDCKYGELYMQDQGYMEPPTCEGIICSKHRGLYMDFTDYCSYGKRREK